MPQGIDRDAAHKIQIFLAIRIPGATTLTTDDREIFAAIAVDQIFFALRDDLRIGQIGHCVSPLFTDDQFGTHTLVGKDFE